MDGLKLGISTISMGWHQNHTLERKLSAAAKHGFEGVEVFYTDLVAFANSQKESEIETAHHIRELCLENHLEIICLGSFDNFEGSSTPLSTRLASALEWIHLAHALGTSLIQVPSNDDGASRGDEETIVMELCELADLGKRANPPISFAYEALGWGKHVADWEESWRIVRLVDRDNFGLCLDTYHVLSRIWADARSEDGIRPGGKAALNASTELFLKDCPADRIFYIQLSDAERCQPPLLPGHPAYSASKDATQSWCMWGRLFPGEETQGAYFPMLDICRAWLVTKEFKGWVSMEIFHRRMKEEDAGPEHWARRGKTSWDKLVLRLTS